MKFRLGVLTCRSLCLATAIFSVWVSLPSVAQREPVLKQIDLPHPYYFREMYLPQLTTGPSSVAWAPDSRDVVYSMAGSLWRQTTGSLTADQLTSGPGYDYQPDWSRDGRWIVYACYYRDAIELWVLDLNTKQTRQLTHGGAVNVEPRFSPDGKRIAFVSTSYNGHFHIFLGRFENGELSDVQRVTGETRSPLARYYYSQFDHEISPVWSPDGSELIFVSNRGHIYGTGGFWRMKAEPGAEAREIHYEETAWKARPDFSPEGKRIVYASYLGQAWHQLWVMPAQGGDPFPISYGDFDNTNPRWSPDGKQIAFISNRAGNTSLWVQTASTGEQMPVAVKERNYLKPMGRLVVSVLDPAGNPVPARVCITGEAGRAYAHEDAWMSADDGFARKERPFEAHYFDTTGDVDVMVPAGKVTVEVLKGFEYSFEKRAIQVAPNQNTAVTIQLKALDIPRDPQAQWVSGDVHVHMNYGGTYRNTPRHLVQQAAAENLAIVQNLVVNKEQRIPDIAYFITKPDPASTSTSLLLHGQEFHTSYWGHLGLLNLQRNLLIPGYSGYPNTAAASLIPTNADVADMAHAQGALVGYVHPFDDIPDPVKDASLTDELTVDVALGKVDYIEVVGFSDHKSTAAVWYRLLNCGFRLPAAAGTDAMANFASLHGPVGLNRVYVKVPAGPISITPWLSSLKQGHTFASNGPLLGFTLGEKQIGDELKLPPGKQEVKFTAWMRSIVPVDHLQVVCNGEVIRDLRTTDDRQSADIQGSIRLSSTGWCLLRAWSEKAQFPILDAYPYATTSPIYVAMTGSSPKPKADADYFIAWIDRLTQAANANQDWNNRAEKDTVMNLLSKARQVYERLQK
jgi:TolB protein